MLLEKLKDFNKEFSIQVKLPSGRKVSVKRLKVKDVKELLLLKENVSPYDLVIEMLKRALNDPTIAEKLPKIDALYLLNEIKKLSFGETSEFQYECPHCGYKGEVEINLTEDLKYKPFSYKPIQLTPDLIIEVYDLPIIEVLELEKEYQNDVSKYDLEYLARSIVKITYKGEEIEDFTLEEVKEFIENLDVQTFEKLVNEFIERLGYITLQKKIVCDKCRKEFVAEITEIKDFL